jgi:hypothetical protein
VNEWTADQVKEFVLTLLDERQRAVEATLRAVEKETDRLAEQYRIDKAQQNEWRGTLNDQRQDLMSRREFRATVAALIALMGLAVAVLAIFIR